MTQWVRFRASDDGQVGFGVLEANGVLEHSGDLFASPRPTGRSLPRDTVTLLNPCQPSKIVALWNNFHALGAKLGKAAPSHPLFLLKPGTCVIGPGEAIQRPQGLFRQDRIRRRVGNRDRPQVQRCQSLSRRLASSLAIRV